MRDIEHLQCLEKFTKRNFALTSYKNTSGKSNKEYLVTKDDFTEFGKVRFEMEPLESVQKEKVYLLNEKQATFLMTYLRNSEVVRKFKKNLVH